jgi:hypothetical protein
MLDPHGSLIFLQLSSAPGYPQHSSLRVTWLVIILDHDHLFRQLPFTRFTLFNRCFGLGSCTELPLTTDASFKVHPLPHGSITHRFSGTTQLSKKERLHRKLRRAGVEPKLKEFEGKSHAQYQFGNQVPEIKELGGIAVFFDKHLACWTVRVWDTCAPAQGSLGIAGASSRTGTRDGDGFALQRTVLAPLAKKVAQGAVRSSCDARR